MIAAAPSQAGSVDFEAWVAVRGAALTRYAYLVCGDASESQDLVQAALEKAWPRWGAIVAQGDPEAYLRRAVTNGAVSRWRKLRRMTVVPEPVPAEVEAEPVPDVAVSDAVWRLCAALPPRQRAAVVLRFYEDLDFAEIGAVIGCPEATARSHVHRALAVLRTRLSPGATRDRRTGRTRPGPWRSPP